MCCGSAGCRGMARTPSALSSQPSIEPTFSCSSAVRLDASADLQVREKQSKKCFLSGVAVPQEVELIIYYSEGWQFDPWLLKSACQSVLGQDTEPRVEQRGMNVLVSVHETCYLKCFEQYRTALYKNSTFTIWKDHTGTKISNTHTHECIHILVGKSH